MKRLVSWMLVLVLAGGVIPVAAADLTLSWPRMSEMYADYSGIGKEFIKKVGSGKYVVEFDDEVKNATKAEILKAIRKYREERATSMIRELEKLKGIKVSPGQLFVKNLIVTPKMTHEDCYYFPGDDITICAGYEQKIKYWWAIRKHLIAQTHFVVYCDGAGFTDCDLNGWSAGECMEGTEMDKIKLITTVSLSGLKPTISWPPSFTVSGTSGTLEDEFEHVSSAFHQYNDLHASDWIGFWRFEQKDDANFKKGNKAIHVFSGVYFQ